MKALLFLTVLLFLSVGAVITFNEPEAAGQQPEPVKAPDTEARFDNTLDRLERKVKKAEKVQEAPAKPRIVYRTRPVGYYMPVHTAKITFGSDSTDSIEVEVPTKVIDGTAVIDGDHLQEQIAIARDSLNGDTPIFIDTAIEEANNHISAWQQVKDFISKPFKKKQ